MAANWEREKKREKVGGGKIWRKSEEIMRRKKECEKEKGKGRQKRGIDIEIDWEEENRREINR